MLILGKKRTVVMTPVCLFYMTSTWETPSSLVIQISEVIELWKSETRYYYLYTLAYILVTKNTGSNKEKQKMSQISRSTKLLKGLSLI